MSSILTYEGKYFDYLNPKAEAVNVDDILRSLPRLSRFVGHSSRAYSVGEHTYHCLIMADRLGYTVREQMLVFIHDFTEAYVGDCPSPLKNLIPKFSEIEEKVEHVICQHLGILPPTDEEFVKIKRIDMTMLVIEMKQLTHHDWEKFKDYDICHDLIDDPTFDLSYEATEERVSTILHECYQILLDEIKEEGVLN